MPHSQIGKLGRQGDAWAQGLYWPRLPVDDVLFGSDVLRLDAQGNSQVGLVMGLLGLLMAYSGGSQGTLVVQRHRLCTVEQAHIGEATRWNLAKETLGQLPTVAS